LFDEKGKLLGSSSSPIQIWKDGAFVEQSSTDIWLAICAAVKAACSQAKVTPTEVRSLGFATTCSLVAVDVDSAPVSVSLADNSRRNVIVWMDHIALEQAERINSSNSPVLQYCGGAVSPEMQPPKMKGEDGQERTQETEDGKWAKVERIKKRMKKGKQRKFQRLSWIGKVSGFCFCRKNRMRCFMLLIRQQLQYLLGGTVGRASEAKDA
ncbi:hypothetical protein S83_066982, partial [Arachis hypogaea]